MTHTAIILTLCLATLFIPSPTQAIHMVDAFEKALDTILCQSVQQLHHTIIDIRSSIDRGADLIDGKWTQNLDTCISECCGIDKCDFSLYKTDGASASGKNCYFINCGDSKSNCVLVEHDGFTSVLMGGRLKEAENPEATVPETVPATTAPPTTPAPQTTPTHTTHPPTQPLTTSTPSHSEQPSTTTAHVDSDSKTTTVSVPSTTHSDSSPNSNTEKPQNTGPDLIPVNKGAGNQVVDQGSPNNGPQSGGSGLIAVAIVGVVCVLIVLIVVAVLVQKVWMDQRRKRFRNVDYLINGMYT